ncbi:TetR/AcrR family transcriptional regulator [Actinomycetospora termitidis]|uniref:TetR/AcrR family transcriptional regulator n=1 Tax=Actinomycetospora termitidis TaxID=3053470 RepID=A0ABT7M6N5_9PSEU|nr:TetR/AcrR family transcriptional regulator [Actinomycetospora sp. Odt1-22]MDL5156330.1 TetR/AcrR family transcriptional regulator [Actinomycetospora sp. Odt1-22]
MAIQERKARERADRHARIVASARDLAEEQGWEAVTTRRLADRIEYSQPVLYGHFPGGKDEIVAAVALAGFGELAEALEAAVDGRRGRAAVAALTDAYLDFAAERPAVYAAMFDLAAIPFAADDTPAALRAGFGAVRSTLGGDDELAEVGWAALHGLATLRRAGRVPAAGETRRRERVVDLLHAAAAR